MTDFDDDLPTDATLGMPDDVTADELQHVTDLLADLPPVPMPDDVAARLDTALRAAPPLTAEDAAAATATAATPVVGPTGAATVTPLADARERTNRRLAWSGRAFSLTAGVAAVVLVSGLVLSQLSGSDRTGAGIAAESNDAATQMPPIQLVSSGTDYTTSQLPTQVDTMLVAAEHGMTPQISQEDPTARVYARVNDPAALQACVDELAQDDSVAPLAVDLGTFTDEVTKGAPVRDALVVVLPSPDDPREVEVFVVTTSCSGPDATLLYFRVLAAADLTALDDGTYSPVAPDPEPTNSATP